MSTETAAVLPAVLPPRECQSRVRRTPDSRIEPCGGSVVGRFTSTCECGHHPYRWLCATCRDVRTIVQTPLCLACKISEGSHDCPMTMPWPI